MRYFLLISLGLTLFAVIIGTVILSHPKFGKLPSKEQLQTFESLPYFNQGEFQNLEETLILKEGESTLKIIAGNIFKDLSHTRPNSEIPSVKTDLKSLNPDQDLLIWLGHSSFYIQLAGKKILIDPILNDYGSPFSFANRVFAGTNLYTADDMPEIDLLLISHDHWDHLDYTSITALESKIKNVLIPLGMDAHLLYWDYPINKIMSQGWYSDLQLSDELTINLLPARHYSGRLFKRNQTLWGSFSLKTAKHHLYFGGDSGYGKHFKEIEKKYGAFDLVMLDSGQYDPRWPNIHMTPEEAIKAAQDLKAQRLFPIHIGKFALSNHAWDEPFERAVKVANEKQIDLVTPKIGEVVLLDNIPTEFETWWRYN